MIISIYIGKETRRKSRRRRRRRVEGKKRRMIFDIRLVA
jgi:hypothetical protein